MPPAKVENDLQLTVKIDTYYKFPKQIEPGLAVSYHRGLHFQIEHSDQPVLFVEDCWMLDIVATPPRGNPSEMFHKEKFAFSLQMIVSLGSVTIGNE